MKEQIEKLKNEILEQLAKVKSGEALREIELKYLSRKGELTKVLKNVAELSNEQKREIGKLANEIKKEISEKFEGAKRAIEDAAKKQRYVDISLPGEKMSIGHIHPVTQVLSELEDMFVSMGFKVLEGPELESDFYCFEALNIPKWHPSRDTQDTFYIDPKDLKVRGEREGQPDLVMRTQTSPMQIRAMQKYGAPLRCVVPGRVFRAEATDAVHEHTFYQLEGLMIDKNITVANLISVLKEMYTGIFKQEIKIRVRPGHFNFVEPGLEVDVGCTICGGKGCPSCKYGGWLEMAGAGMVHPKVLEYGGVDPKKYSGFAFGMGIERLLIMRHGVNDIRLFESGDMRFLEQF